jgi:hypothetical protein
MFNVLSQNFKLLRSTGIDYKESIPPNYVACAGIYLWGLGTE